MSETQELLDRAIEVFPRGFAATRCNMHPCLAERIGKLWLVKDVPRARENYR